jgi:regulatory protein
VLYWLARRDYSQQEIVQKLKLKKYPADAIQTVIAALVESSLINEPRFTENYTRSRSNKGYGPVRIMQELQARGISAEMIAEHVQIADNAWLAIAQRVWRKHFKSVPDDMRQRAKQMRFLQYRGFTQEQIKYALGSSYDDDTFN